MKKQLLVGIGALCILIGGLWTAQGLNWIGGSGMSGETLWAIIGLIVVLVGAGLITVGLRRPAP